MMLLNQDILHEIFSLVQHDKPILCSLAQVNRQFSNLVPQYMFRHVHICQRMTDHALLPKSLECFVRSIDERPSLALLVRSLDLSWDTSQLNSTSDCGIHDLTNHLLEKLSNLHSLNLEKNELHGPKYRFVPTFLHTNPIPSLHSVTIRGQATILDDLVLWLLKPGLRSLSVEEISHHVADAKGLLASLSSGRMATDLSSLLLGVPSFIPQSILEQILQLTPVLRDLGCGIPVRKSLTIWTIHSQGDYPKLSLMGLKESLLPAREHLVSLILSDNERPYDDWTGIHGPCLDLSSFTSLKHLRAPAPCFYASRVPGPSRDGVYKLLPRTLEELQVSLAIRYIENAKKHLSLNSLSAMILYMTPKLNGGNL